MFHHDNILTLQKLRVPQLLLLIFIIICYHHRRLEGFIGKGVREVFAIWPLVAPHPQLLCGRDNMQYFFSNGTKLISSHKYSEENESCAKNRVQNAEWLNFVLITNNSYYKRRVMSLCRVCQKKIQEKTCLKIWWTSLGVEPLIAGR